MLTVRQRNIRARYVVENRNTIIEMLSMFSVDQLNGFRIITTIIRKLSRHYYLAGNIFGFRLM